MRPLLRERPGDRPPEPARRAGDESRSTLKFAHRRVITRSCRCPPASAGSSSVLVADVAGSTAIGERLGPERSKFLFDELVTLMRREVERYGGTVAQLTGDGLIVLFGAPVAQEDDSVRAVRAALALRQAVARYAAEIGPAYDIELSARVAVNTGPGRDPGAVTHPRKCSTTRSATP